MTTSGCSEEERRAKDQRRFYWLIGAISLSSSAFVLVLILLTLMVLQHFGSR